MMLWRNLRGVTAGDANYFFRRVYVRLDLKAIGMPEEHIKHKFGGRALKRHPEDFASARRGRLRRQERLFVRST